MTKIQTEKENNNMENCQKEIMTLANDFCLNMVKAKEMVHRSTKGRKTVEI